MDPVLDAALRHQTTKHALDARNTSFSTVSVVTMMGKQFGVFPSPIQPLQNHNLPQSPPQFPKMACASLPTVEGGYWCRLIVHIGALDVNINRC